MRAALMILLLLVLPSAAYAVECGTFFTYKAKITDVYDGDTVTADIDLGFNTWKLEEKLRLNGIDAPELRGNEKAKGLRSRDALRDQVLGKTVTLCTIKDEQGKYGRYLAKLYVGDQNINDWLVANGYAVRRTY